MQICIDIRAEDQAEILEVATTKLRESLPASATAAQKGTFVARYLFRLVKDDWQNLRAQKAAAQIVKSQTDPTNTWIEPT